MDNQVNPKQVLSRQRARMGTLWTALRLGAVLLTFSVPAAAQPRVTAAQEQPSTGDEQRDKFIKAVAAVQANQMAEARQLLLSLWAKHKTYDVAALLAQVERLVGRSSEAANHAKFALAHYPPSESKSAWARLQGFLDELRPQLLQVDLEGLPETAQLRVDQAPFESSPPPPECVYLSPGAHVLSANINGRQIDVPVSGKAGETKLARFSAAARAVGDTGAIAPPDLGTSRDRGSSSNRRLKAALPLLLGSAGVLVLGVGVGIGFGSAANGLEEEREKIFARLGTHSACALDPTSLDCVDLRVVNSDIRHNRNWGTAGWITAAVGGVGLAAVATYVFAWPDKKRSPWPKRTGWQMQPYAQSSGAGLLLSGAF